MLWSNVDTTKQAGKRRLRKLLKEQMQPPRVMITDKLASYGAAKREIMPGIDHRRHKGRTTEQKTHISRAAESGR